MRWQLRTIRINRDRVEAKSITKLLNRYGKRRKVKRKVGEEQVGEATIGEGVVVIPQDPNALVEMLSLRMASFQAGNTGVRNEIVGICDELLRQGTMNTEQYKNLMLQL